MPAVPQHPARQGQDPSRLPHPAPADPPSGDLTTVGADPDRAYAEPADSFGQELDELDGSTAADPGPLGAIRAAFAQGQLADSMSPGCVLAGLSEQAWQRGLAGLDEDQLTGMLQAANRLAAWSAALRLAAVSQLAGRRAASAGASGDQRALEHVRDEIAITLTLTGWGADRLLGMAMALDRLPLTQAALATGTIDERRADVIADELAGLSDEHAARVEAMLLPKAAAQTTAELRRAARRAVISADPAAAKRRKEKALQDARVETFTEAAGTAALAGRDLPPAAVLAADQHLTSLAMAMRQAGADGPLDQLRARAYLHLLCGQPAGTLTSGDGAAGQPPPGPVPSTASRSDPGPGQPAPRGTIHLTMPLASWLGWSESPGEAAGYGPLDADDARALATWLAAHPATTWCVTLIDTGGRPVAHGCAGLVPGPAQARAGAASRRRRSPGSGRLAAPDHYHAAADQRMHSSPGRQRLPARTQAAAPHPGPQRVLYRARVPSAGAALRSGPHHPAPPGRPDLRVQPGAGLPPPSPLQASPGLGSQPAAARRHALDHARRTHLHDRTHRLRRLTSVRL